MKSLFIIGLLVLMSACSNNDATVSLQPSLEEGVLEDVDYNHYFDSLSQYGSKYGFQTIVPQKDYDIILSNPTDNSITATILTYKDYVGHVSYNTTSTQEVTFKAGIPQKIILQNLLPNSGYSYQFYYKRLGASVYSVSPQYKFSTTQYEGTTFSFAIIADSHLDENCDTSIYKATLSNVQNESNAFIVDLGDTFMTDKYGKQTYSYAYGQYLAQRYYFGSICHSLPLFFVQGNHDGETGEKEAGMTAWSKQIREKFFPNPVSDNYYAWNWGNALMIVLDPFTFTPQQGGKDYWQRTLGDTQYHWLETTLRNSNKKYKFVFIHNLVGGLDNDGQARGGAEVAPYWEWGGLNVDGSDEFTQNRSWNEPIHALLKKYGVQIVFHGHDHLFAKQEFDGIIYQCVQQPGLKHYENQTYGNTFGYKDGIFNYYPGHIKVTISPSGAKVDYISFKNTILYSYSL